MTVQEYDGQPEHEQRPDQPILQQRQSQNLPIREHVAQFLVFHLGQRREHHQDQADGDGDVRRIDLETVDQRLDAGKEVSDRHADDHGQENPEGQIAVEEGEPLGRRESRDELPDFIAHPAVGGQAFLFRLGVGGQAWRVVEGGVDDLGFARQHGAVLGRLGRTR